MSEGGVPLAGSPLQRQNGIEDSPEQGFRDMVAWGEDIKLGWAKNYTAHGTTEVHDWPQAMGVKFENLLRQGGNFFACFHFPKGRGFALVSPIYLACLQQPNALPHAINRMGQVAACASCHGQ